MNEQEKASLLEAARAARANAYAPYSVYPVGAAVLTEDGRIFSGCNVENISFGLTMCAERGAISSMVASGNHAIQGVAVVTRDGGTPCGMCRQVLVEFAPDPSRVEVVTQSESGEVHTYCLSELLPSAFRTQIDHQNENS